MQDAMKEDGLRMWRRCLLSGMAVWLATAVPASAFIAYVSNEKGNTVSVIDTDSWTVTKTIKVGQRPRGIEFTRDGKFVIVAVGDDDSIQIIVSNLSRNIMPERLSEPLSGFGVNHTDEPIAVLRPSITPLPKGLLA